MEFLHMNEMIERVEMFLWDSKQVKVKIIINNPMTLHRDMQMLNYAYNVAIDYYKNKL
jgi:hypothetical protein